MHTSCPVDPSEFRHDEQPPQRNGRGHQRHIDVGDAIPIAILCLIFQSHDSHKSKEK